MMTSFCANREQNGGRIKSLIPFDSHWTMVTGCGDDNGEIRVARCCPDNANVHEVESV